MKKEIVEKLSVLITSAFGFVAALAWNSAIQQIFQTIFGQSSNIAAMVAYATVITVIAVTATVWIGKVSEKLKH